MAVSGSKDFSITRADIIEAALRKIGVYDQGEAVPGEEVPDAALALNLMVKEWVMDGADIFLRTESTLFLQPDTQSYNLSTDHITDSYVESTLASAVTSGTSTSIPVTDSLTNGMSASDFIGIKMDDNTIHWSTISAINAGDLVNIADATDDDAAAGNKVYAYTTKSDRPQKILYAFRSDKNGFDTEISVIGENEYRRQSNKTADGAPTEIWYNPQGNQATGKLSVWPDNGGVDWDKIVLIAQHLPDDFDAGANNPDFPIEWGNALVWGLAAELCSEYSIPEREQTRIWSIANNKLQKALDYDVENASVIFALDSMR